MLQADPTNKFTRVPPPSTGVSAVPLATANNIAITYNGFTPEAQAAFQYAVNIWQTQVSTPVDVRVNATFGPLASGVLGSAGATFVFRDFPGIGSPETWYAKALANNLRGTDLYPSSVDINADFNSIFAWYYGVDGMTPAGRYDFASVVLHELAHGLGYFGSASVSSGVGSWGWGSGYPHIYDRFVENASAQPLLNTALFPNPSVALATQLQGNALYWNGPAALRNAGSRPRLYAPAAWLEGSSYSHLDEFTYPAGNINSLMSPALGAAESIHDPGPMSRGMLADEGWTVASAPCSGVTLSPNQLFPVSSGTSVTWTALAAGCDTPQYQFWLYSATTGQWSELRTWSTGNTASWTPAQAGTYAVQVWARRSGSTAAYEGWAWSGYVTVTSSSTPCSQVTLSASVAFPLGLSPVTWTAQASGCSAPEYRFLLYSETANTWTELRGWSASNTANWTPAQSGRYVVQVWARHSGSSSVYEAWAWSGYFDVLGASGSPCSGVTLSANTTFPVGINVPVIWTAQATGCSSPEYQFWLYSGNTATWTELRTWSSTPSTTWIPSQSGTYAVQAWARNAGSTAAYQAWAWSGYVQVGSSR